MMEEQQEIYDTITVMNEYNFHKPISISVIIEDNESELNQSKASKFEISNVMCPSLQDNNEYKNCSMQQQNLYIRNGPKNRSYINPAHNFSLNGSKRNVDQKYLSNNNLNIKQNTDRIRPCSGVANENNCSKAHSPVLHNSQKGEGFLINSIAENLALIMEAFVNLRTITSKSNNKKYISHLRGECLRVKLNLFHKCLAISNDFLIQYENNKKLIEKILYKTKQMSKVTLPTKHYEQLYEDLLQWIKLKKCDPIRTNYQNTRKSLNAAAKKIPPATRIGSKPIPENKPTTKIFSSGPLGRQVTISVDPRIIKQPRISQNMSNSTTTYLQTNNTDKYNFSYSNCSSVYEKNHQYKQSFKPNAASFSNLTYCDKEQLTQHAQNNSCNAIFTANNETDSQDITRSSISRDSGFISPLMSDSPSEYYINNVQPPSTQYEEQRTLNYETFGVTSFEPNVATEGFIWNHV